MMEPIPGNEGAQSKQSDGRIPKGVIKDPLKAELIAHVEKPYYDMAILARQSGIAEEEVQNVLDLANTKSAEKGKQYEEAEKLLKEAIERIATDPTLGSNGPTGVLGVRGQDVEVYEAVRDKLYAFLGVLDQRKQAEPDAERYQKGVDDLPDRYASYSYAPEIRMDSPLGFSVIEGNSYVKGSSASELVDFDTWHSSQQVQIDRRPNRHEA